MSASFYFLRFIVLFAVALSVYSDVIVYVPVVGDVALAKVLILLVLLLVLITGYYLSRRQLGLRDIIVTYFFILLSNVFFSGYGWSEHSIDIMNSIFIGISFIIILLGFSKFENHFLLSCSVLAIVGSCILGGVQAFSGIGYFTERVFSSIIITGTYRASGLMSDPNYFALVIIMNIPIAIYLIKHGWGKIAILSVLIMMLGLLLTGSRAGILIGIVVVLISIYYQRLNVKWIFICGFLVAMSLFIFREFLPESLSKVFDISSYSENSERNSLQDRALVFMAGLKIIEEYPLFGYGLGNFRLHPYNIHHQVSHNNYIELLAETGFFGLSAYLFLIVYIFYKLRQGRADPLSNILFISLFGFMMMSVTLVTYYSRINFFLIAICLAHIYSKKHIVLIFNKSRFNQKTT